MIFILEWSGGLFHWVFDVVGTKNLFKGWETHIPSGMWEFFRTYLVKSWKLMGGIRFGSSGNSFKIRCFVIQINNINLFYFILTKLNTHFLLIMFGKFGKEFIFLIISESMYKLEQNNRTNGSCKCTFNWRNPQNSTTNL